MADILFHFFKKRKTYRSTLQKDTFHTLNADLFIVKTGLFTTFSRQNHCTKHGQST